MFPLVPRGGRHAQHIGNKPEDAVISLGGDASFKVRATATAPAWVEWYRADGDSNTLLLGTNNNARFGVTLTLTRVQAADAGKYFAVITNDWGTATSQIARVIIDPTFIKITEGSVVTDRANFFLGTWADYDGDGFSDLFVMAGTDVAGQAPAFYRNLGGAGFVALTSNEVGDIVAPAVKGGVQGLWADFNNDGSLDLLLTGANYPDLPYSINRFFLGRADHSFDSITQDIGNNRMSYWPWQSALVDYDNDGFLDFLNGTALFRNDQNGGFTVALDNLGPSTASIQSWGDYNNGGHLDFVVGYWDKQPCRFYHNNGDGTFTQVSLGSPSTDVPAGESMPTWCDFDNDGFLDLFVATRGRPDGVNFLYRNAGRSGGNLNGWLMVKPVGTLSNRSAVGAKVRVLANIRGVPTWQMRQISGTYYDDLRAHFGLGDATKVERVRIEWPSGIVQELSNLPANQFLTVTEPPRLRPLTTNGFQIQCWLNQSFDVETSTDLATWTHVTTLTNEDGTLEFHDPDHPDHDCRYYRVVSR